MFEGCVRSGSHVRGSGPRAHLSSSSDAPHEEVSISSDALHEEVSISSSLSSSPGSISSDDIETLCYIIAQLDTPTSASISFAHKGKSTNFSSAFYVDSQQPWIIYSGASDHMTNLSSLFSTYNSCSCKNKVRIADGSPSPISGKGVVNVSSSLSLSSVLYVPRFSTNLLSISRVT